MIGFAPTDDQRERCDAVRSLAARRLDDDVVRRDAACDFLQRAWWRAGIGFKCLPMPNPDGDRDADRWIKCARHRTLSRKPVGKSSLADDIVDMKVRLDSAGLLFYRLAWLLGEDRSLLDRASSQSCTSGRRSSRAEPRHRADPRRPRLPARERAWAATAARPCQPDVLRSLGDAAQHRDEVPRAVRFYALHRSSAPPRGGPIPQCSAASG